MSRKPAFFPLYHKKGTDDYGYFTFYNQYGQVISLDGCTAKMQIKNSPQDTNPICEPSITILSTSSVPQVRWDIAKAQSRQIPTWQTVLGEYTKYWWDVQIIDNSNKAEYPIEGPFLVEGVITL